MHAWSRYMYTLVQHNLADTWRSLHVDYPKQCHRVLHLTRYQREWSQSHSQEQGLLIALTQLINVRATTTFRALLLHLYTKTILETWASCSQSTRQRVTPSATGLTIFKSVLIAGVLRAAAHEYSAVTGIHDLNLGSWLRPPRMYLLHSLSLPVLWGLLGAAAPADYTYRVEETVLPPHGWVVTDVPAPSGHTIALRIGLPQSRFAELEYHLYAVRCVTAHGQPVSCMLTATQRSN